MIGAAEFGKSEGSIARHDKLLGVLADLKDVVSGEGNTHRCFGAKVASAVQDVGNPAGPSGKIDIALWQGGLPLLGLVTM